MSIKLVSIISTLLVSISVLSQVYPRPTPRPMPQRPGATIGVVYGQSDTCDMGKVEAIIRDNTDCRSLKSNSSWSIKVGQVCKNISDTTVQTACLAIQTENAPDVVFGQTDTCDMSKTVAPITPWTDCGSLRPESSWSVKINGVCQNISDTNGEMACRAIQFSNAPNVIFGQSDTCDMGKVEAAVDEETDCDMLSSSASSWSVKVNGVCQNTSDTNVRSACRGIQSQNARNVIYGQSDTCDSSKVVAVVGRRTQCESLSNESSWSIKINGVCQNISDTTAVSACKGIQYSAAPNVIFGQSDTCDMTKAIVAVTRRTDCSSLRDGKQSSWSVKLNGVCKNISDTNVTQACLGVQSEMP